MKIKRILVSQPKPSNGRSPYFDLEEKYNVKVDFRQFIEVKEINSKEFKSSKVNIADATAIIMTSKTAVNNFFRICKEMKVPVSEKLKYFCMSEAIALYLQKYITYRKRKIFFGSRTVDDLIVVLEKHKKESFLLPLSESHNPELPEKLTANKINYSKAILYKTVSSDLSDLENVDYDVLVFFSPLGINSLLENFPKFKQNGTAIASFGNTTAKAVENASLRLDIAAPNPQAPSMTKAIENFINQK